MGSHSFPAGQRGREAKPAVEEATNWSSARAKEVAAELGLTAADIAAIQGSGKDGVITVADVKDSVKE